MKILLIFFLTIVIAGLIYFIYLGHKSKFGSANGLLNSKLTPCSKKPNCICTKYPDDKAHYSEAIKLNNINIDGIIKSIQSTGGVIITTEDNYIAATYTSGLFKYVDDFEIRIDTKSQLIHIRSASRVGHSDMGANLKRIESFKTVFRE
jgi:uncharacterized protein (DUF1499 family)